MLKINFTLLFFLSTLIFLFDNSFSANYKQYFCKEFNIDDLINGKKYYKQCFSKELVTTHSDYYQFEYKNNKLLNIYQYKDGILVGEQRPIYNSQKITNFHFIKYHHIGTSYFKSQNFIKVVQEKKNRNYLIYDAIKSKLIMFNNKSYILNYFKKVEYFDENNTLKSVEYYDFGKNNEIQFLNKKPLPRLLVQVSYYQQKMKSYKIIRYDIKESNIFKNWKKKNRTKKQILSISKYLKSVEEYYENDKETYNFYDDKKLVISFTRESNEKSYLASLFYYGLSNSIVQIKLKEDYLVKNKSVFTFFTILKPSLLIKIGDFDKKRRKIHHLLKPFHTNPLNRQIERVTFYYFYNQPYVNFYNQFDSLAKIQTIEYYTDDVIRRIKHYDRQGLLSKTEFFDQFGEKIFGKE